MRFYLTLALFNYNINASFGSTKEDFLASIMTGVSEDPSGSSKDGRTRSGIVYFVV